MGRGVRASLPSLPRGRCSASLTDEALAPPLEGDDTKPRRSEEPRGEAEARLEEPRGEAEAERMVLRRTGQAALLRGCAQSPRREREESGHPQKGNQDSPPPNKGTTHACTTHIHRGPLTLPILRYTRDTRQIASGDNHEFRGCPLGAQTRINMCGRVYGTTR